MLLIYILSCMCSDLYYYLISAKQTHKNAGCHTKTQECNYSISTSVSEVPKLWMDLFSAWPHPKWWIRWPGQIELCGRNWLCCLTEARHTSSYTGSSVRFSIHHEAKTGQKTMGNEAWLILLVWGHKQSAGTRIRRKQNPSGPTSCRMHGSSSPW